MGGLNLKKRGGIPLFLLMNGSSNHMLDDDGNADQDEDGSPDDICDADFPFKEFGDFLSQEETQQAHQEGHPGDHEGIPDDED